VLVEKSGQHINLNVCVPSWLKSYQNGSLIVIEPREERMEEISVAKNFPCQWFKFTYTKIHE